MKKKLALLIVPALILATSTSLAANLCGVIPYVGADAEWRHMNFKQGYGNNLFNHNYPQGNLYVGAQLNEYLAVEAGYEATERKTRTSTLNSGDVLAGVTIPTIPTITIINDDVEPVFSRVPQTIRSNSTGQIKGLHANLVGLLPICDLYRLQLIGLVGFARLKANFVTTITSNLINGVSTALPAISTTTFK